MAQHSYSSAEFDEVLLSRLFYWNLQILLLLISPLICELFVMSLLTRDREVKGHKH